MPILEGSIKALELAKLVTTGLPFPGLNVILDIALSIAKKAKVSMLVLRSPRCIVSWSAFRRSKTLETTAELSPNVPHPMRWQYASS